MSACYLPRTLLPIETVIARYRANQAYLAKDLRAFGEINTAASIQEYIAKAKILLNFVDEAVRHRDISQHYDVQREMMIWRTYLLSVNVEIVQAGIAFNKGRVLRDLN